MYYRLFACALTSSCTVIKAFYVCVCVIMYSFSPSSSSSSSPLSTSIAVVYHSICSLISKSISIKWHTFLSIIKQFHSILKIKLQKSFFLCKMWMYSVITDYILIIIRIIKFSWNLFPFSMFFKHKIIYCCFKMFV